MELDGLSEGFSGNTVVGTQETRKSNKLEMFGFNVVSDMLCYLGLIITSKAIPIPFHSS